MSEHIQKSDHAARQSRRGGKRLAAGQAERERKCPPTPPEVQPEPVSAPTAVKPLIPEWGEEPAGPSRRTEPRRRRLRQAVQSWQDTEGEISPVVTGCQALAEKAKNTRRHWRRLVRRKKAKRFPESERFPVQLLLLAWGMLPTLGGCWANGSAPAGSSGVSGSLPCGPSWGTAGACIQRCCCAAAAWLLPSGCSSPSTPSGRRFCTTAR